MQENLNSIFIPILTSESGRSLTVENWQQVGTNVAAFDLTALLMKPGFELLSTLPDLASYTGWSGTIVLNASMPKMDRDGGYVLRSEYDGARKRYTIDEILILITQLKPQLVILPEEIHQQHKDAWRSLPKTIIPFFSPDCLPDHEEERSYGVFLRYEPTTPFENLLKQIGEYSLLPKFVGGDMSLSIMQALTREGAKYLMSDIPAHDACHGVVYHCDKDVLLKEPTFALQFGIIAENCKCPTCEQLLTRAYLHHLLEHTPLLCQRFLIQHNIHYCHTSFTPA